ncbi:hypothetical protein PBI_INDLOVU_86 [Mycobacterium phage Indlovu]|nr:hypothetical protein PBI_INDLOVU_86 [Mycobacterium phage Indlovu]
MDPDATLDELRSLAARVRADHRLSQADVERAGELFDALDGWIMRGGYLPRAWRDNVGAHFYGMPLSGSEVGAE